MKGFMRVGALALLVSLSAPFATAGSIVVLGVQEALRASDAAKAFREELSASTASEEQRVIELEKQARELQSKLQSSQGLVSQDELGALQLQFQKAVQEFQRQRQALQQNRAEQEQAFLGEMRPKLDKVITQLIKEEQISIILSRQSTIYMEPGIDVTAEVVKRLNEED